MQLDFPETLVGLAEIAVSVAGFTGVVVAFRSSSHGSWHAGDRLRLAVMATLQAGIKSPDLGGDADTETFTSAIIDRLD